MQYWRKLVYKNSWWAYNSVIALGGVYDFLRFYCTNQPFNMSLASIMKSVSVFVLLRSKTSSVLMRSSGLVRGSWVSGSPWSWSDKERSMKNTRIAYVRWGPTKEHAHKNRERKTKTEKMYYLPETGTLIHRLHRFLPKTELLWKYKNHLSGFRLSQTSKQKLNETKYPD